jgi:CMP-N-acetylneuraminate monooxygenase
MTRTVRTRIGQVDELVELPARIATGSRTWFLVREADGYRLLSTVCPHQGGDVVDRGSCFECPLHGWRFDRQSGRCLNAPSKSLSSIAVTLEGGTLFADLPGAGTFEHVGRSALVAKPGLTVHLHAHACLEVSYEGFRLLTDPWLDGPAFMGAWAPYPPPQVSGAELRPDAILITHEHSDHFHEPTLRHFDRRIPIFVPDFPNQRLTHRLAALGFLQVTPLRFGEAHAIHQGWTVTAFEAESYWNDAFALIDVEGFRVFNINDAGINHRIAGSVSRVDLLAVQFSAGASGYPWTWAHLSDEQKVDMSRRACAGKLNLIRESVQLYRPHSVLPFASHFTLWHPSHEPYRRLMKRNSLADVKAALHDVDVDVVDLLPGETWNVGNGLIHRLDDRDQWSGSPSAEYLERIVGAGVFSSQHPTDDSLSRDELVQYLQRLNAVPDIVHCEDLTVRLRANSAAGHRHLDVAFAVAAGRLSVLQQAPPVANLDIEIPLAVLTSIVRDGLSWDEAFIGYWCRFDRHPNVYHAGFWRLLQAPYLKRPPVIITAPGDRIGPGSTIAELLESYGAEADRILRRYGLYCLGCHHSAAESIEMGARHHGVPPKRVEQLIHELNSAFVHEGRS